VTVVLDASALLAVLYGEKGADVVEELLDDGRVSAVNWSEVLQKLAQKGADPADANALLLLGVEIEPFTAVDAVQAAELHAVTREFGLSLADRACLALACRLGVTAVTADRAWAKAEFDVPVQLVR
jgi:ribonuclease VapC